ncbi:MAG: hypothetical protein M3N98_08755 [Actinomycetota bacterium]|nr:hypothetical protein [Actinomycetota bacterium]
MPAGDADVFDDDANETLPSGEVEFVDPVGDGGSEAVHAFSQPIVGGELGSFGDETVALGLQTGASGGELLVAA